MDAAATARSMSVELAIGTWRMTSPEAGFVMSPVRVLSEGRRLPPIQNGTVSTRVSCQPCSSFSYFPCSFAATLNFVASFSLSRARIPISAPTATNWQPSSSQCLALASSEVRIPGALPAFECAEFLRR